MCDTFQFIFPSDPLILFQYHQGAYYKLNMKSGMSVIIESLYNITQNIP